MARILKTSSEAEAASAQFGTRNYSAGDANICEWRRPPGTMKRRAIDIGRCTADGSSCLVGRRDQMVKVNGIRVESAESEQQLQQQGVMFASCVVEWLRQTYC